MILHKLFFIGVNTFTNTNLEMSVLIKREKRSVPFYLHCVAHKWFVYVSATVARRDDKERI